MLDVGVKLPAWFESSGEFLADGCAYEAAGAHSLWLSDEMFRPPEPASAPAPGLDVMTLLAALAAVTSRVRLGTSVAVPAQWPPALWAQVVATLDRLSHGRLVLGVGAGAERLQLEANGVAFEQRGSRLDEMLRVARSLWAGRVETFEGRFYRLPAVRAASAVRPEGPPILVGASADPGLRRAARLGDGFISAAESPEAARREFERVLELRRAGAAEAPFELWAQVPAPPGRAAWRDLLAAYADAGAGGVIVEHAPNLLDILRNPEDDDRHDLRTAVG